MGGRGENGESFRDLKNFLCKLQRKFFKSLKDCSILVRNSPFSPLPPTRGVSQRSDGVGRTSWTFLNPKLGELSIRNIFRGVWKIKNPP